MKVYRTDQKTASAGEVFGVFDFLGISPDGDWEVCLGTQGSFSLVNDATGAAPGLQVGPALSPTRMIIRNEEVYVKNRSSSSGTIFLLAFQV